MSDDLTRRAIIAAHDAGCDRQCGEDALTFRRLTSGEQAIVALWREDRDDYQGRYETSHDSRMHAEGLLDAMTREARLSRESTKKAVKRAEKAEAEVERLRTATGMADELGARVTDERNEAQAAIERVRALVADVYAFNQIPEGHIHGARDHIGSAVCLAMKITSALDGTEATDA